MKKSLIKLDRALLDLLTTLVKKWIKKNDYELHKVDFQIKVHRIKLISLFLLAFLIPGLTYLMIGKIFAGTFHMAIWSISVGMNIMSLKRLVEEKKPYHDILFSLRKNPQIYEMEKQVLNEVFESMRKSRLSFLIFDFFLCWAVAVMMFMFFLYVPHGVVDLPIALFFLFSPILSQIDNYLFFVFDFDEPEERKKAKDSISEIVLRAWNQLIGGFNPLPQI